MKKPIDHYHRAWKNHEYTRRTMQLLTDVMDDVIHQCLHTKNKSISEIHLYEKQNDFSSLER